MLFSFLCGWLRGSQSRAYPGCCRFVATILGRQTAGARAPVGMGDFVAIDRPIASEFTGKGRLSRRELRAFDTPGFVETDEYAHRSLGEVTVILIAAIRVHALEFQVFQLAQPGEPLS